jgi:hypothetical protein
MKKTYRGERGEKRIKIFYREDRDPKNPGQSRLIVRHPKSGRSRGHPIQPTLDRPAGYYLLIFYLALEFFFYLWNVVGGALHGFGLFFHLADRDPVLWAVNAVGYLSFFAAGYFLLLLIARRRQFQPAS